MNSISQKIKNGAQKILKIITNQVFSENISSIKFF